MKKTEEKVKLKDKILSALKNNKTLTIMIVVAVLIQVAIYCYVLLTRQYIYVWDSQIYYKQQMGLLSLNFFEAFREILRTTFVSDYGDFLLIFTTPFFALTNKTPNAFVFTYMLVGMIPIIIVFALILNKILKKIDCKNKPIAIILSLLFLSTFPFLIIASIEGVPDFMGLFWAGLIVLLLMDIDFSKIQTVRWLWLIMATFALVITRRWYVFLAIGIYLAWGIIELIYILVDKDKENKITKIKNFFSFVFFVIFIDGFLVSPILYYTIAKNYAITYTAWSTGGLIPELNNQIAYLGWGTLAFALFGLVYGLINKNLRKTTLIMTIAYFIAIIGFTSIQNMGYHQMLMLAPTYIYLIFVGISAICNIKFKYVSYVLSVLVLVFMIFNFKESISSKTNNNNVFTYLNYQPTQIANLDKIKEVHDFIAENCDKENKAYINAAGTYCKHTFSNLNLPDDMWLDDVIPYEASVDSAHGFPTEMLSCKYVFVTNVVDENTGAVKGHIIPGIMKGITEDDVISKKYKLVKTFDMGDGIVFSCYERIGEFTTAERESWMRIFADISATYPELFMQRIELY